MAPQACALTRGYARVLVLGLYTILQVPILCVYIAIPGGRGETLYCAIVRAMTEWGT